MTIAIGGSKFLGIAYHAPATSGPIMIASQPSASRSSFSNVTSARRCSSSSLFCHCAVPTVSWLFIGFALRPAASPSPSASSPTCRRAQRSCTPSNEFYGSSYRIFGFRASGGLTRHRWESRISDQSSTGQLRLHSPPWPRLGLTGMAASDPVPDHQRGLRAARRLRDGFPVTGHRS